MAKRAITGLPRPTAMCAHRIVALITRSRLGHINVLSWFSSRWNEFVERVNSKPAILTAHLPANDVRGSSVISGGKRSVESISKYAAPDVREHTALIGI